MASRFRGPGFKVRGYKVISPLTDADPLDPGHF